MMPTDAEKRVVPIRVSGRQATVELPQAQASVNGKNVALRTAPRLRNGQLLVPATLLASDGRLALWWGTRAEAVSAICRLRRAGHIDERPASRLLREIDRLAAAYEVQPTEALREAACRMLRVHELRAADALQLAAALIWADGRPSAVGFVCLDQRLRTAAEKERLGVLP